MADKNDKPKKDETAKVPAEAAKAKADPKKDMPMTAEATDVAATEAGVETAPLLATPAPTMGTGPAEEGFAASEHVAHARKIYKKEPWLIKTVLRNHGPDDVLDKDTVRDLIDAFERTPLG